MMENNGTSHDEMRLAVKRAILLNEHLLRRAWGVLYLAFALSMFLSIFAFPILNSVERLGVIGGMAMSMTASGCAIIAILWAFKRVRNSAEITRPEDDRAWSGFFGLSIPCAYLDYDQRNCDFDFRI